MLQAGSEHNFVLELLEPLVRSFRKSLHCNVLSFGQLALSNRYADGQNRATDFHLNMVDSTKLFTVYAGSQSFVYDICHITPWNINEKQNLSRRHPSPTSYDETYKLASIIKKTYAHY